MKKLVVNTSGCIGCGACVGIDEEHFDLNEDYLSYVISQENLDSELLKNAITACPVSVISIETTEEEQCNCESCESENCNCVEETDNTEEKHCNCESCECENCNCVEETDKEV